MIHALLLPLLLMAQGSSVSNAGHVLHVNDASGLRDTLKRVGAGDKILLAPGDYGKLEISETFDGPVWIQSSDRSNPARVAGIKLEHAKNVYFADLDIGRSSENDSPYASIVEINASHSVGLFGGRLHGSLDNNPHGDLTGLKATDSSGLRVERVLFQDLSLGAVLYSVSNFRIFGNEFTFIQSDGLDFASVSDGEISLNSFSRFIPAPGDHPDAIQCWTRGQRTGCRNLRITNNLIRSDVDHRIQGIFFGDEVDLWKTGNGHRDIQVEGNYLISTLWNSIYFYFPQNVTIVDNIVANEDGGVPVPGGPVRPWIMVTGNGGSVERNVAPYFKIGTAEGRADGNRLETISSKHRIEEMLVAWRSKQRELVAAQ